MTEIEDIKKLLQDTQKKVDALTIMVHKIHHRLIWHSIMSFLKLLIIVVPIVLSIWYFQPQIQQLYNWTGNLFGSLQALQPSQRGADSVPEIPDGSLQVTPEMIQQLRNDNPQFFQ